MPTARPAAATARPTAGPVIEGEWKRVDDPNDRGVEPQLPK